MEFFLWRDTGFFTALETPGYKKSSRETQVGRFLQIAAGVAIFLPPSGRVAPAFGLSRGSFVKKWAQKKRGKMPL
jgi:uncharacterized oligopeptide transporter (OPT) family protein